MTIQDPEVLVKATQYFADHNLTPEEQTLIALFLQTTKTANAAALSKIIMAPLDWVPFRFMHEQYFKELELISLLAKATSWSMNPQVYAKAMQINLKFMQKTGIADFMSGGKKVEALTPEQAFYEYLAVSHAFMSQIRLMPLFPTNKALDTPFLNAINEIEVHNGRMIQTQIRLLKDIKTPLSMEQREHIIERNVQIVREIFTDVIRSICMPEPAPTK